MSGSQFFYITDDPALKQIMDQIKEYAYKNDEQQQERIAELEEEVKVLSERCQWLTANRDEILKATKN